MNAYELLKRMKEKSASDLYLKVGLPPSFRIHGEVIRDTTFSAFGGECQGDRRLSFE